MVLMIPFKKPSDYHYVLYNDENLVGLKFGKLAKSIWWHRGRLPKMQVVDEFNLMK